MEREEIIQIIESKRSHGFALSTKELSEIIDKDKNTLDCLDQVSAFGYIFSRRIRGEDCWHIRQQGILRYRGQSLFSKKPTSSETKTVQQETGLKYRGAPISKQKRS